MSISSPLEYQHLRGRKLSAHMTTSLLHVDTSRSDVSPLNLVITNGSLQLHKSPLLGGVRHQQYFDTFSFMGAMGEWEKMIISGDETFE